jgi:hypothetical protein
MFIDEWFDAGFYKQLPLDYRNRFSFGQIFWTHAYYPHENLQFWRPKLDPAEPTKTIASEFNIVSVGQDAFRRAIPLAAPKLETNEEFIVIRAKVRPVLLIQPEMPVAGLQDRGYKGKVQRHRCSVAQIFGLADTHTGEAAFDPAFVDRIRRMEFPQFLFLPKSPGLLDVDSFLRLDELQSVFTPHLDPTRYSLADDLLQILKGQMQFLFTETPPPEYSELRELLLTD